MPDSITSALYNGERQVAPDIGSIRRDHVARYEWLASLLNPGATVLDIGCGVGYGSKILANRCKRVFALDCSREALDYGRQHYSSDKISWFYEDAQNRNPVPDTDSVIRDLDYAVAVCFEVLEHLSDPQSVLRALSRKASMLYASVPNEAAFPFNPQMAFHHRHYTKAEFIELLESSGWKIEWCGSQMGPESEVANYSADARTLVVSARRIEGFAEGAWATGTLLVKEGMTDAFGLTDYDSGVISAGKNIAIVGLGSSIIDYVDLTRRSGGRRALYDEVWVINALGDVLDCDLIFHMDDVRIQEIRAKGPLGSQKQLGPLLEWMRSPVGPPIITSRAHPDYPRLVEFPLADVLSDLGHPYFNSTAAYAVALAIHRQVSSISIFGMDYTYPNAHHAEKGRACVEYWLGVAMHRGILITVGAHSTLMDACEPAELKFYGYDTVDVGLTASDGKITVELTERETMPTMEEIEERYDHRAHPNTLMRNA